MRAALFTVLALTAALSAQRVRLHPSGAFFTAAGASEESAAEAPAFSFGAGDITPSMLAAFGGARSGPRIVENLAFAMALARECEVLKIARSAPTLARSQAAQQTPDAAGQGSAARARRATEALRDLRIAALIGAERAQDQDALRALFEHRYGVGGVRVQVRHVLCTEVLSAPRSAAERAAALKRQLSAGASFEDLLAQSHDRVTRRLLRDPKRRDRAGLLPNYNYHRYGEAFADAVRDPGHPREAAAGRQPIQDPEQGDLALAAHDRGHGREALEEQAVGPRRAGPADQDRGVRPRAGVVLRDAQRGREGRAHDREPEDVHRAVGEEQLGGVRAQGVVVPDRAGGLAEGEVLEEGGMARALERSAEPEEARGRHRVAERVGMGGGGEQDAHASSLRSA